MKNKLGLIWLFFIFVFLYSMMANAATGDFNVDEKYTRSDKCKVYFDTMGGHCNSGIYSNSGISLSVMPVEKYGTLPTAVWWNLDQKEFIGWYTDPVGGTLVDKNTIVTTTSDHTLYAHWKDVPGKSFSEQFTVEKSVTVRVTWDPNGGRCSIAGEQGFRKGEKYRLPSAPVRRGYKFLGWFTEQSGGKEITKESVVETAEDHTIYAHWEEVEEASVNNQSSYKATVINKSEELLKLKERDPYKIFGCPDDMKLQSSMTLFAHAAPDNPLFRMVLENFFNGEECRFTLRVLGKEDA